MSVIGPFKGINKEYTGIVLKLYITNRVLKLRCLAFSRGPGGFRELRDAGRKHFHLSWYLSVPVVASYGQKPWGDFFKRVRYVQITTAVTDSTGTAISL